MTKPKKIAVVCNYQLLPERVGGMDYFFWQFDHKCKQNNILVDWFFPNTSHHGSYPDLTIYAGETASVENHFLKFCSDNATDYSHIITHFIELCTPFFKKAKQISKAKIIAIDHNPRPLNGYPFEKRLKKKIKGVLYAKYINTFVGVSKYTKTALIKDFGSHVENKIQVIYNGIDLNAIQVRSTRNHRNPSFLTASHLRESKGIQDLIQAVFVLPESIKKSIKIDIYGDGPYREELQNQVKILRLESCFNFMGSTPDLKSMYCQYDYMLQPTHMECFSLSVLESLAANVPVITTPVGGNLEIIHHNENGFIFEAKDYRALSEILKNIVLGNLKIEKEVSTQIEKEFNLDKMVNEHIQLLH
jgi:L-malate glycosyltransferase